MTGESPSIEPNPQALYAQRRRVELLRQQVFAQEDPEKSAPLMADLLAAEEALIRLEQAGAMQEPGPDQGLLYNSVVERGAALPESMGKDTTRVETKIYLRLSHVPTGIVHLMDGQEKPLVSVMIDNVGRQIARLRVTSCVENYSATAVDTLELFPGQKNKEVKQLPVFFIERLRQIKEITRASLRVHVQHLSGETEMERTFPIWLLARTTAYLKVNDPQTGRAVDLTPYLAAWVTPNAPQVMDLLRRAADLHPQKQIAGYQVGEAGVEAQVKAIFEAVKQEQLQYVNSVFCFGRAGGEFMQRIRLPRETLKHHSANCIDGTILMASVLEAASLNPAIVLVPGHAFLAWETLDGSDTWDYLETTLISTKTFEEAQQVGRSRAERYRTKGQMLRLLSIPALRVDDQVLPME